MKNLSTENKEERGVGGRIAMNVKKVIESPENHEEGLTRRGRGLKSIRADCRGRRSGREKHRQMGKAEGQKAEKERRG